MADAAESPPPERQTGAQLNDPPASGQGLREVHDDKHKHDKVQSEVENLPSNPQGPMDSSLDAKFSKQQGK